MFRIVNIMVACFHLRVKKKSDYELKLEIRNKVTLEDIKLQLEEIKLNEYFCILLYIFYIFLYIFYGENICILKR